MIRIERVRLPDGLRALAHRDRNGNLVIYVSNGLDAKGQRAAIIAAIRASRRAGWRKTGLLPVGVALFLAIRALLGRVGHAIGARPVAWGAATPATVVAASAAGIFIASAPHPRGPPAARRPGEPGTVQPAQPSAQPSARPPGGHAPRRQVHPVVVAHILPAPGQPRPAVTSPGRPAPTSPPAPAPSPPPTEPTPAPVPTPCRRHHRHPCICTHRRHAGICRHHHGY